MNRYYFLLVFFFYQIHAKAYETKYVWNIFGIEIKKEPTLNSETVIKIDFGEKIEFEVINELGSTIIMVDNFFKFSGSWLNISFEGNQGYIFNGFLSSREPPINKFYTINEISILGKKKEERVAIDSIEIDSIYYFKKTEITQYENGEIRYLPFDGCFNYTYTFLGLTKNEVQNIILSMYYKADAIMEVKLTKIDNGWKIYSYSCD